MRNTLDLSNQLINTIVLDPQAEANWFLSSEDQPDELPLTTHSIDIERSPSLDELIELRTQKALVEAKRDEEFVRLLPSWRRHGTAKRDQVS